MKEHNEPEITANTEESANEPTLFAKVFFDKPRHNLITRWAETLLTPTAKSKIDKLLENSTPKFTDIGDWADDIKSNPPPADPDTKAFFQNDDNRANHSFWHYVNLPLDSQSYAEAAKLKFTRHNDVIQMAKQCIRDLQGTSSPARFSKINALRLISHFVGDIHQPLHIGCGFIDETDKQNPKFVSNPQTIRPNGILQNGFVSDSGGNATKLPGAGKMHGYWDGGLGGEVGKDNVNPLTESVGGSAEAAALNEIEAKLMEDLIQEIKLEKEQGFEPETMEASAADSTTENVQLEDLPELWGNDALKVAKEAYRTFAITERIEKKQSNGKIEVSYLVSWEGKQLYNERCVPLLRNQLKLAIRRLAELLNQIFA